MESQRRKDYEADIELGNRVIDVTHAPNFPVIVELLDKYARDERQAADRSKHEHSKVVEHLSRAEAYESIVPRLVKIEAKHLKARQEIEKANG